MSRHRTLAGLIATIALLVCVRLAHADPLSEVEAAFADLRLAHARELLDTAPSDAPRVLYFKARLAIWDHATKIALDLASRCLKVAAQASICHEVRGEAISLELLDSGLLQQYGLARQARSAWERAVELDPNNLRARLLLLRYYRQAPWIAGGSRKKAAIQAQEIAARDPARAPEAEGLMAYFDGAYAQALTQFEKAHAQARDSIDPRYYVPLAATRAGDHATAIQAFADLIETAPEDWGGWYFLGYAKLEARPSIDVTPAVLRATCDRVAPPSLCARALYADGRMLKRIGERRAARAAFSAALSVDTTLTEARTELAQMDRS